MGGVFSDANQFEDIPGAEAKRRVLVTGGTGLVGKGIEIFIADDEEAKVRTYNFQE